MSSGRVEGHTMNTVTVIIVWLVALVCTSYFFLGVQLHRKNTDDLNTDLEATTKS